MLKFFRKYNMLILVVGGCLLMVSFLVGSSIQQLQGMWNNKTIATMRGEKISANDFNSAQQEFSVVKTVLEPVIPVFIRLLEGERGNAGVESWLMLSREAERLGLVGGELDGQNMLALAADMAANMAIAQQYGGMAPQLLEFPEVKELYDAVHTGATQILEQQRMSIVRRGARSERGVDLALAKAHGVLRLFTSYRNEAALLSTPELREQAERVLDVAVIEMVTIPALIAGDELPDPSEAELLAQFEEFRSVKAGGAGLGFGYLRPPAVQLEWISIQSRPIEDAITLDPVKVRVHHKNFKTMRGWSDDFAAEREKVEYDLKSEIAAEVVEAGVEAGRNEMRRMMSGLEADGEFRRVPDDWRGALATTESVAEKIRAAMSRQAGMDVSGAVAVQSTGGEWKAGRDLLMLPGVGNSISPSTGAREWQAFNDLALKVRGIVPDAEALLQVGLLNGPTTAGVDRFFFRVTGTRPESPPESIEEVRTQVARDLRVRRGWELLNGPLAEEIKSAAIRDGLSAVARQYGMDVQTPIELTRLSMAPKMASPRPIVGENQEVLRNAVLDRVGEWDPLTEVESIDPAERVIVMPIEQAKGLVVVKITGRYPVTTERLYSSYSIVENWIIRSYTEELSDNIYSFERLKERFDFKLTKAGEADEDAESVDTGLDPSAIPPG